MFKPFTKDRHLVSQLARAVYFMACFVILLLIIQIVLHAVSNERDWTVLDVRALKRLPYDLEANRAFDDPVVLSVQSLDSMRVNGEAILPARLRTEVENALSHVPTRSRYVVVKASPELEYRAVIKIIDELKGVPGLTICLQLDYLESLK